MKLSVNVAIQMLALAAQGVIQLQDLLSPRGKFYAAVGLTVLQGISAVLAHFVNPDGTTAAAAYIKEDK